MNNKNVRKKLIWQTVFAVTFLFILVVLLFIQYSQFWSLRVKENQLNEKLQLIQQEREMYENEYDYITSDEYIEDYAHEVLGWGRNGETYFSN